MSGAQNSNPGWVGPANGQPGTVPTAQTWNSLWSSKVDAQSGYSTGQTLSSPKISGGSANFSSLSVNGVPVGSGGLFTSLPTPIASSANVVYSAAQMLGGVIWRTGPTATFTDQTDTAVNILSSYGAASVNSGFEVIIANGTSYNLALTGGTGVSLSAISAIPSNDWGIIEPSNAVRWLAVFTAVGSAPELTLARIGSFAL